MDRVKIILARASAIVPVVEESVAQDRTGNLSPCIRVQVPPEPLGSAGQAATNPSAARTAIAP